MNPARAFTRRGRFATWLSAFGDEELSTPLSGNEIRQLLTMSAEDVRPENLGTIGAPFVDKAAVGWDPHFGYGRVNLAAAMARLANEPDPAALTTWPCDAADNNCIPPEAQLDSPDWFAPINVDRLTAPLPVKGHVAAPHSEDEAAITWEVEYACGQDAPDADFEDIPDTPIIGTGPRDGLLGTIPVSTLEAGGGERPSRLRGLFAGRNRGGARLLPRGPGRPLDARMA